MAQPLLLMLVVFVAASACPARAEDDPVCARYTEPLAYNACLASHGPKAKDLATKGAHHAAERIAQPPEAARTRAPRIGRGSRRPMRARGRMHMEFRLK
jgi:hypothetical protein